MGLKCRIAYIGNRATVYNEDGTTSKLYEDLLQHFEGDQNEAIEAWAVTQADDFFDSYPEKEIEVQDVLRYIDTVSSEDTQLSPEQLRQVSEAMNQAGFTNLSDFNEQLVKIFKPNGTIELNQEEAIESGIFDEDALRNLDLDEISSLMIDIEGQLRLYDINIESNTTEFSDTTRRTFLGTHPKVTIEQLNEDLRVLVGKTESEQEFLEALDTLPYSDLVEELRTNDEFYKEVVEKFTNLSVVPRVYFDGEVLTDEDISFYSLVKNTVPVGTDTALLESKIRFLEETSPVGWEDSNMQSVLKDVAKTLVDYNVDVVGLENLQGQPVQVVQLLNSAKEMLEDPTDTKVKNFSDLKQELIPDQVKPRIESLPEAYRGYNILSLQTVLTDQELLDKGLIKIGEDLYHKVALSERTDLYEYIYQMYTSGELRIPNKYRTIKGEQVKEFSNKTQVLQDLETFVNSRDTGLRVESNELLSLHQVAFRHEPIPTKTREQQIQKAAPIISEVDYLTGDFISDFYNYVLEEKSNNSEVYKNVLSKFTITPKDITLIGEVSDIAGIKYQTELEDYIRLRRDSSMDHLLTEVGPAQVNSDLMVVNFPETVEEHPKPTIQRQGYTITESNLKDYIKVGDVIYRKVIDDTQKSIYVEAPINNNPVYLSNSLSVNYDHAEAQNILDSTDIIPSVPNFNQTANILVQAGYNNRHLPEGASPISTQASVSINTPTEVISAIENRLKQIGLSNDIVTLTPTELQEKLEELGVSEEVRNQVIAWHGTANPNKVIEEVTNKNEKYYGKLMSGTYFGTKETAAFFSGWIPGLSKMFEVSLQDSSFEVVDMKGKEPGTDSDMRKILGKKRYKELLEKKESGEVKGLTILNAKEPGVDVAQTQYVAFDSEVIEKINEFRGDEAFDLISETLQPKTVKLQKELGESGITLSPQGFVHNNTVYLNEDAIDPVNTLIHEHGHLFNSWAKVNRPDIYDKGINLIKEQGQEYIDIVKQTQPNLKGEALLEEALTQVIGDKGARIVDENRRESIREWLEDLWQSIKDALGITQLSTDQLQNLNLQEFAEAVSTEMLSGESFIGEQGLADGSNVTFGETSDIRYQLIGESDLNTQEDKLSLSKARDMESSKDSRESIYRETGWFKTKSGEWLREIKDLVLDKQERLIEDITQTKNELFKPLSAYFNNTTFGERLTGKDAYLRVNIKDGEKYKIEGTSRPGDKVISAEVEITIPRDTNRQEREEAIRGLFKEAPESRVPTVSRGERQESTSDREGVSTRVQRFDKTFEEVVNHEMTHALQKYEGRKVGNDPMEVFNYYYRQNIEDIGKNKNYGEVNKKLSEIYETKDFFSDIAYPIYKQSVGEVEADLVANRLYDKTGVPSIEDVFNVDIANFSVIPATSKSTSQSVQPLMTEEMFENVSRILDSKPKVLNLYEESEQSEIDSKIDECR